jgi:AcrR family transcriptional regulator
MNEVAKSAKIAKGTLYIYFKTKDELALDILGCEYENWFKELISFLNKTPTTDEKKLAKWIVLSLKRNSLFLELMPLGSSLFESNVDYDYLVAYKKNLHFLLTETSKLLSKALKLKNIESAANLLIQIHVTVQGLIPYGYPVNPIKDIILKNNLNLIDIDYFKHLENFLERTIKSYVI